MTVTIGRRELLAALGGVAVTATISRHERAVFTLKEGRMLVAST